MGRFTMNATASVIVERDGRILLTREYADKKPENSIILSKPGGHLEDGETFQETAIREAFEETGYRVRLLSIVGVYYMRFPDTSSVNITFTAELVDEKQEPITENDIVEVLWMPVDEFKARRSEWRRGSTIPSFDDYFAGKRHPLDLLHWSDHTKTP